VKVNCAMVTSRAVEVLMESFPKVVRRQSSHLLNGFDYFDALKNGRWTPDPVLNNTKYVTLWDQIVGTASKSINLGY
jgi:hypothetical protein